MLLLSLFNSESQELAQVVMEEGFSVHGRGLRLELVEQYWPVLVTYKQRTH